MSGVLGVTEFEAAGADAGVLAVGVGACATGVATAITAGGLATTGVGACAIGGVTATGGADVGVLAAGLGACATGLVTTVAAGTAAGLLAAVLVVLVPPGADVPLPLASAVSVGPFIQLGRVSV
jgi:hypothetical protein